MKKSVFLLVMIVVLAATVVVLKHTKKFERIRYESFLQKEYRQAPPVTIEQNESAAVDQPEMAAFQDQLMTLDPSTGSVPRERLIAACERTDALAAMKSGNNTIQWQAYSAEMGGRTRAIMFDPTDPAHKKVWAGGVTGGLWYNNDITSAISPWVPVGDFWPCLAIHCITADPNNPAVFYIGTGEPETAIQTYRESSGLGDGIWKSTDAGQTWSLLSSTTGFAYITKIAIRNESGNSVLYAGVVSGLYHDGPHQSLPSDGLFRSADGGTTWQQVLPNITGLTMPYSPSDVVIGADGRIFVGTMPNIDAKGAATILFSDTGVPGSWTKNETFKTEIESGTTYPIPGRVMLGCAASDPNVVYALIGSGFVNSANNFKYFYCFHVLRSADKGVTWAKKNLPYDLTSGVSFATIAWHALDLAVDPNNKDNVFIGGLDVQRTTDGGVSWSRLSDWSLMYYGGGDMYVHADQHIMVFSPGSSTKLALGCDGGVFFTSNANAISPIFGQRNQDYNTLQFYSGAIKNIPGAEDFLGGLQDNGSLWYDGTPLTINSMRGGGDGAFAFYDKNDPDYGITSTYYNWYHIWNAGGYQADIGDWQCGVFVNPADYDYRTKTIYANACDFIGTNVDYYVRINDVLTNSTGTFVPLNTGTNVYFSTVKWSPYSPVNKATLFIGTQSGSLYKVQNAESNPTKTNITGANFPFASISSLDIGRSEDTLLVTFSNYGVTSVFKSFNGGQTWQNAEGNLPDMPVRWCLFHPSTSRYAMVATETGVWQTSNLNETNVTWTPVNNGMANVRVDMLTLRESDNMVLAATHGRGLFTCIWDVTTGIQASEMPEIKVYPNPTHGPVVIERDGEPFRNVWARVFSAEGKVVYESAAYQKSSAFQHLDLGSLPDGLYYIGIYEGDKRINTTKLIKN